MCGIAGVLAPGGLGDAAQARSRLEAMAATVAHRGPDDRGSWHDGQAGLAAARLAVVDLTPAGHQPMHDASSRLTIAFNGEIYNFRDLRRRLEEAGHRFRTRTDTEVIMRGYAAWGEGVVDRLRGMFAFAVWDAGRQRLLLARDRLGQKPLYYSWHDGVLLFGSEIKAILAWPGTARRPDYESIHRYLGLRYVPGPGTAFAGVARLQPAHLLSIAANGGATGAGRPRRYWSPPTPEPDPAGAPDPEAVLATFDEAVRLRLAADVPVGAFLSGGIDSSSVVATMAAAGAGPVRTFTVGFEDAALDERARARLVAGRYGTHHTEVAAGPDLAAIVPALAWHYGEPFADPVAIPTYLLAAEARRHVTVVLTGDGGDELFLGYRRHAASRLAAFLDHAPGRLRAAVARAARRRVGAGRGSHAERFLAGLDRSPADRYGSWVSYLSPQLQADLYDGQLTGYAATRATDLFRPRFAAGGSPAQQAAAADLHTFLPDDLLVRLDVATMAHGLEARSPFLDHELVELALRLPVEVRMPRLRNKGLFRTLVADRLPAELLRQPKLGFSMPLELRRPADAELVRDALAPASVRNRGLFRPEAVQRLLEEHYRGSDFGQQLWTLVVLEWWFRTWIDVPPT